MAEVPPCRGYPFLQCASKGKDECFNESCVRRDTCCSSVLVSVDASVTCGKKPHDEEDRHYVEIKEHYGATMVAISWPSRKDPFNGQPKRVRKA